jgi:hypothetical protein
MRLVSPWIVWMKARCWPIFPLFVLILHFFRFGCSW